MPVLPAETLQPVPGQGKSWPCAGEPTACWKLEKKTWKKVAWESYLSQNSLKVLNHRGLRRCFPLETLPHACNHVNLVSLKPAWAVGEGGAFLGAHLHSWYKEKKPDLTLDG